MDSQTAFSWVTVIAVSLSALLGAIMLSTVCRSYWKSLTLATTALLFALIGTALITTPKWTQIAFEWGDIKIKIAKAEEMQRQFASIKAERDNLLSKTVASAALIQNREQQITILNQKVEEIGKAKTQLALENEGLVAQKAAARSAVTNALQTVSAARVEPWRLNGATKSIE